MGIKGLTTFIAKNANEYLRTHQLHDTYLVIDGNNLACHLYTWHCKCNDCFGGDYDKFAHVVCKFFSLLQECNVIPLVVFDGGYEDKKLRTVYDRMRQRVNMGRSLNSVSEGSVTMYPLFIRELFKDLVLRLKVKAVKCDFEGDYEIACIARTLNCPVLSYDSDFYLFDIMYIPFSTMELQSHRNKEKIKYIPCKIYMIDRFLKSFGGLSPNNLPLLAVLLGNDYIKSSAFANFYNHIKLPKRNSRSDQQRKILAVVNWLQHETFESAVKKILGRMVVQRRKNMARRIKQVVKGYICKDSEMLKYLGIQAAAMSSKVEDITALVDEIADREDGVEEEGEEECVFSEDDEEEIESEDGMDGSDEIIWRDVVVPEWFLDNFRRCLYPSAFMDILFRNTYYFTPQLEDYSCASSHNISLKILAAMQKILRSESTTCLNYLGRNEHCNIQKYKLWLFKSKVPALNDIKSLDLLQRKSFLFQILNVDLKFSTILESLPSELHLYILSVKYWFENAKPQVLSYHLYALILCAIVLKYCDPKVGYHRSTKTFLSKYESKIKSLNVNLNASKLLNEITFDDALHCMKEVIDYFQLDFRMRTNMKLYDISILHIFAQFQSCLLHINYLNSLLNFPFEQVIISDFYDGTFIYNVCMNFSKRTCLESYLKIFLKSCPVVLNNLLEIVNKLDSILEVKVHANTISKRRRRRRNKKNKEEEAEQNSVSGEASTDADDFDDENNRFSVLFKNKCVI